MLKDFYAAFATVCFTLLGLWIIVVQTRHSEWRRSALHRRRAYGISLYFALPGLMSLLSLVNPASTDLWRVSFAIVAAGGAVILLIVRGPAPSSLGFAAYVAAVVLYLLIAVIAVFPSVLSDVGITTRALRAEAILQALIVFLGANIAWLLVFDDAPEPSTP
jgi:cytochrome bd-type quinol oxidase subunit 2